MKSSTNFWKKEPKLLKWSLTSPRPRRRPLPQPQTPLAGRSPRGRRTPSLPCELLCGSPSTRQVQVAARSPPAPWTLATPLPPAHLNLHGNATVFAPGPPLVRTTFPLSSGTCPQPEPASFPPKKSEQSGPAQAGRPRGTVSRPPPSLPTEKGLGRALHMRPASAGSAGLPGTPAPLRPSLPERASCGCLWKGQAWWYSWLGLPPRTACRLRHLTSQHFRRHGGAAAFFTLSLSLS